MLGHPVRRLVELNPFKSADTQRLAMLFAVVYFAQGMWSLPVQTMTIVFKEHGLSAADVARFFSLSTLPWLIKPAYGLLSDFVPLFGRRRQTYFLGTSALASLAGFALALSAEHGYWRLALLYTAMGFGLAFTDVLTDALMVESGKPRGLTGAFQSVQWAAISIATLLVGVVGGQLAAGRDLHRAFALSACFPLISFFMAWMFIREPRARFDAAALAATWASIRIAATHRDVWLVAGFILFYNFSPSFGPALLYYQTDTLHFSQQFIGLLGSLGAAAGIAGAAFYAPVSRRVPLRRMIVYSIGAGVAGTLGYLLYRDWASAMIIDTLFGGIGMVIQLTLLDLAAKSCPKHAEGTFFAMLMSIYNAGVQGSQVVGGMLYDWAGYTPLVLISAATTALAWLLVPLLHIDRIEARARADADVPTVNGPLQSVSER